MAEPSYREEEELGVGRCLASMALLSPDLYDSVAFFISLMRPPLPNTDAAFTDLVFALLSLL